MCATIRGMRCSIESCLFTALYREGDHAFCKQHRQEAIARTFALRKKVDAYMGSVERRSKFKARAEKNKRFLKLKRTK
jgi:hypothetical protein